MIKIKKNLLVSLSFISIALLGCSNESHESELNGDENIDREDVKVEQKKAINQEENKDDERTNNMESYSITINKVQNKKTKLVGNIVLNENFDEVCEVTGNDSDLVSVSIDENKKNINISSNKRYLDTSGNLVIKIGVPIKNININQGKFNLDISVNSTEQFHGVFECAVNGEIESNNVNVLDLDFLGSGNIELEGNVEYLDIFIEGSSIIEGKKMEADDVKVKLEGVGSCSVYSHESLTAYVEGVGSITYYGKPDLIDKKVDGLGFIKEGD
ncbi:GIN domain-containing protein [Senegalia sp. (in: firmicutes)]|uniref:GIN domain-containing protein n=1 Tax=Senegalia sp. (in: firmicutes) TaxID=1924098 RepID=UPI003F9A3478